jgi:hypothetical protein
MMHKQRCPFCDGTGSQSIQVPPGLHSPTGDTVTQWVECPSCLAQGRCPACGDWPLMRKAGNGAERSCRRCNWEEGEEGGEG